VAQTGDPLVAIQQKLRSQIKLTRTLADRTDIVTAGSVVELRVDGLMMYGVESPLPPSNTYKNGRISQGASGFGKDFAISLLAPDNTTASDYPHRKFVAGEKVWVTSIAALKDGVLFQLYSDPYDDGRLYANLKIPYPNKKEVPQADVVLQILADVMAVVPSDGQNDQDNQAAAPVPAPPQAPLQAPASPRSIAAPPAPPRRGTSLLGEAPRPAPLQEIAPPPAPVDAPPPTIAIGQTTDQVGAAFGLPQRLAKLGVKEIFYYKDMKVTFTSGKVSSVD
jgi:hypothetical protein